MGKRAHLLWKTWKNGKAGRNGVSTPNQFLKIEYTCTYININLSSWKLPSFYLPCLLDLQIQNCAHRFGGESIYKPCHIVY